MNQFKGFLFLLSLLFLAVSCADLNNQNENTASNSSEDMNNSKSLVVINEEPEGTNCAFGGKKIESGLDKNNNGVLEEEEVNPEKLSSV